MRHGIAPIILLIGIGLVAKKEKNRFEWVGGDVDSSGQVEPDEAELQRFSL